MEQTKNFAKGIIFKRHEKAPDFVIGNLSIKLDEAIQFLNDNSNKGWVNLSIKKSKSEKFYIEIDNYDFNQKNSIADRKDLGSGSYKSAEEFDRELPF